VHCSCDIDTFQFCGNHRIDQATHNLIERATDEFLAIPLYGSGDLFQIAFDYARNQRLAVGQVLLLVGSAKAAAPLHAYVTDP